MTSIPVSRFDEIQAAWEGREVLVVGDVMLDRYLWGSVSRISPEAPVPVVEVDRESFRLGGAANVAHNLLALGAHPRLVGVVGKDGPAGQLREHLEDRGIGVDLLVEDGNRPTSLKTRIVARGQHVVRADQESREELEGKATEALFGELARVLDEAAAVIVSDYGKGVITAPLLERLLPEATRRALPVCVDPKDTHFFSYRNVRVLTPNQHEAAEVLGFKLRDDESVSRAGREILARLESDSVLITRGAQGMSLFEADGSRVDLAAVAREVYDVTGAGDTVVSAFAASLAGGASLREAAVIANQAAGLVVAQVGTAVADPRELRSGLDGG